MANYACLYLGSIPNVSIMPVDGAVANADGSSGPVSVFRRGDNGKNFNFWNFREMGLSWVRKSFILWASVDYDSEGNYFCCRGGAMGKEISNYLWVIWSFWL